MNYAVRIRPAAQRQFARLPAHIKKAFAVELDNLTSEPRPHGCRKMVGSKDTYRIRIGDYRAVYQIDDAEPTVLVTVIGHRSDVYR